MGTLIVVGVIAVIMIVGIVYTFHHFKGQGGCCGGASDEKQPDKQLENEVVGKRVVHIDGMHCQNCSNTVERYLNRVKGAAATVDLDKKTATVLLDRDVRDSELIMAVELAGFKVTGVEYAEVQHEAV